jgi:hypothetical protein
MTASALRQLGTDVPRVRLLDATALGIDDAGLRALARAITASPHAPHVSRSYCYPFALLAWHSGPVGVDVERVDRCDEHFADLVCSPQERPLARLAPNLDAFLTSMWSAKEALAKGLGDALAYDPARLESPDRWPGGRAGLWRSAPVPVDASHVAWVCWRGANAPSEAVGSDASGT